MDRLHATDLSKEEVDDVHACALRVVCEVAMVSSTLGHDGVVMRDFLRHLRLYLRYILAESQDVAVRDSSELFSLSSSKISA